MQKSSFLEKPRLSLKNQRLPQTISTLPFRRAAPCSPTAETLYRIYISNLGQRQGKKTYFCIVVNDAFRRGEDNARRRLFAVGRHERIAGASAPRTALERYRKVSP